MNEPEEVRKARIFLEENAKLSHGGVSFDRFLANKVANKTVPGVQMPVRIYYPDTYDTSGQKVPQASLRMDREERLFTNAELAIHAQLYQHQLESLRADATYTITYAAQPVQLALRVRCAPLGALSLPQIHVSVFQKSDESYDIDGIEIPPKIWFDDLYFQGARAELRRPSIRWQGSLEARLFESYPPTPSNDTCPLDFLGWFMGRTCKCPVCSQQSMLMDYRVRQDMSLSCGCSLWSTMSKPTYLAEGGAHAAADKCSMLVDTLFTFFGDTVVFDPINVEALFDRELSVGFFCHLGVWERVMPCLVGGPPGSNYHLANMLAPYLGRPDPIRWVVDRFMGDPDYRKATRPYVLLAMSRMGVRPPDVGVELALSVLSDILSYGDVTVHVPDPFERKLLIQAFSFMGIGLSAKPVPDRPVRTYVMSRVRSTTEMSALNLARVKVLQVCVVDKVPYCVTRPAYPFGGLPNGNFVGLDYGRKGGFAFHAKEGKVGTYHFTLQRKFFDEVWAVLSLYHNVPKVQGGKLYFDVGWLEEARDHVTMLQLVLMCVAAGHALDLDLYFTQGNLTVPCYPSGYKGFRHVEVQRPDHYITCGGVWFAACSHDAFGNGETFRPSTFIDNRYPGWINWVLRNRDVFMRAYEAKNKPVRKTRKTKVRRGK